MSKFGNKGLVRDKDLTARIVKSVEEGKPYSQIAKEEDISAATVCRHVKTARGLGGHVERKPVKCEICGELFEPLNKLSKRCKSKECRRLYTNRQANGYYDKIRAVRLSYTPWGGHCVMCSKEIPKDQHYFCSNRCRMDSTNEKRRTATKAKAIKKVCPMCGTEFLARGTHPIYSQKACSPKCSEKLSNHKKRKSSYDKKKFTRICKLDTCRKKFSKWWYYDENGNSTEANQKVYCSKACHASASNRRPLEKARAKKNRARERNGLEDKYIIEQIAKCESRKGNKRPKSSEVSQLKINLKRIEILAHRGEQLDKDLSNQEKIKQFEETLTRTLRGNTAILPK